MRQSPGTPPNGTSDRSLSIRGLEHYHALWPNGRPRVLSNIEMHAKGHFRPMRIDMTLREQLQRITLAVIAYSIIVAALVTAPLVSFLTESPTSLLARWLGAGFVATVIAANLVRACFARKLAGRNTTEPLEDELEPARVIEPAHQNRSTVPSGEAQSGCQRLKIVDLMVLIAAIAFGIALARSFLSRDALTPGRRSRMGMEAA